MSTIPADIVTKFYEMDPNQDDLLPHASFLRDGMVVLIESSGSRSDITNIAKMSDEIIDRGRKINRWARVSHVLIEDDNVHFVATYADGSKRKRQHNKLSAWLVKIDSMGWERDVAEIAAECRLAPSVTFALLAQGWQYVSNPSGINENQRAWFKEVLPRTTEK